MLFPLTAALTLIKWGMIFVTTFSAVFTNLLSGVVFVVAVLSFLMGQESGPEALRMLVFAFGIFILPYAADWCIDRIADFTEMLRRIPKSVTKIL